MCYELLCYKVYVTDTNCHTLKIFLKDKDTFFSFTFQFIVMVQNFFISFVHFKINNEKSIFISKVDLIDKNDILYIWLYSHCIHKESFAALSYFLIYWYIVNCVCKRNISPIFKPSNNLFLILILKFIYQSTSLCISSIAVHS